MSYGMVGSASGPVSPRSWLEGIYDYAVKVMNPDKVFFGMPAYGWNWRIHGTPENMGVTYRALPHVHDYMEEQDAVSYDYPLLSGTYNRRHYLTAYSKQQETGEEKIFTSL